MKNKKTVLLCSIVHWQKARNNEKSPGTAKLRWKARLPVLDPTVGCFYQVSRKQRLLVETLYVS